MRAALPLPLALLAAVATPAAASAELPHIVVVPPAADSRFTTLPAVEWFSRRGGRTSLKLYERHGDLSRSALDALSHLCADVSGARIPMAPRVLQLVYKAAVHFASPRVEIVSAYRAPKRRDTSHHGNGSAIDFRIEGVSARTLAEYVRRLAHVGVGYYPRVDFVHLDVRDASYFWVNRSRAGRHGWDRPLPRRHAVSEEDAWTPEWDLPWSEPRIEVVDSRARADFVPRSHRRRRAQ